MEPNPLTTNLISRAEYESRHSELQTRILQLDTKMDGLSNKIDSWINTVQMRDAKAGATIMWKFIATSLISLIGGSGLTVVIDYLSTHHP